jgi:hypothetical protein
MRRLGAHGGGPGIPVIRHLAWLAVLMMIAVAMLGPGAAGVAASRETGNNGTVKIHEGGGEPSPEVKNQPHVCTFHIHFFFADAGQSGNWEIQKWAPGPKGAVVMRGTYHTNSKGEDRQPPAPNFYTLPDGHYKLFWDGDTGKHDKMKVFWVKCAREHEATPTPPGGGGGGGATPTPPGGGGGGGATPTPPGGGGGGGATPTPPGGGGGGGATPTPPGGGGGGVNATPTPPSGGVGGVVGTPNVSETLPPTDALSDESTSSVDGWRAVLIAMAALLATVLLLTPARVPAKRLIRRR